MYTVIDGNCFKNMLVGAYQLFQKKYEIINQLNVFSYEFFNVIIH